MIHKRMLQRMKAVTGILLLLSLACGCGAGKEAGSPKDASAQGGRQADQEREKEEQEGSDGRNSEDSEREAVAMGRFVGSAVDLSDALSGEVNRLFVMGDGNLLITDQTMDFALSEDDGATWRAQAPDWYERLRKTGAYILDMAVAPDGTAAVIYEEDAAEGDDFCPGLVICDPKGGEISVDLSLTPREQYPRKVWISQDGEIFAGTFGNVLYQVDRDGTGREFLTLEEGRPELVQFAGNYMILDGRDYGGLVIYDRQREEYVEDAILEEFIRENYGVRSFFGENGYDLFFFPGEEGVLYLAGEKGLHRHVIAGSAMEQVIDGRLGSFSDPDCGLLGMVGRKDHEFLALFTGGRAVRFSYDPDVPALPGGKLTVYSLKENDTVRRAVGLYQSTAADAYAEYVVGMGDGSVTREDAIRKLNTEIMAGNGPDVIVLDGLPADSYMEKGALLNLQEVLGQTGLEGELFSNIVDAFRENGGIYMLPCEISFPVVQGRKEDLAMMEDLEGMAQALEKMRRENPERDLIEIYSEKGVMKFFARTCAPDWKTRDGELNRGAIRSFLSAAKRIFEAQRQGLADQVMENYILGNEESLQYNGIAREEADSFKRYVDAAGFASGRFTLMLGVLGQPYGYAEMTSVPRVEGLEDVRMMTLNNLSGHVFVAETLAGISASCQNRSGAAEFLSILLGQDMTGSRGFSINRAAFEAGLLPNEQFYEEGKPYLITGGSDWEGNMTSFSVYWMDEEQKSVLRAWMEEADTPYRSDYDLEEAVYAQGEAYLRGEKSLEEAVEEIERKTAMAMAE